MKHITKTYSSISRDLNRPLKLSWILITWNKNKTLVLTQILTQADLKNSRAKWKQGLEYINKLIKHIWLADFQFSDLNKNDKKY